MGDSHISSSSLVVFLDLNGENRTPGWGLKKSAYSVIRPQTFVPFSQDGLLDVSTLLEMPATSRISCLGSEHIQKLRTYYQKEPEKK